MAKQIPQEKLDYLNRLLDRELEGLETPVGTEYWNAIHNKQESQNDQFKSNPSKIQTKTSDLQYKIPEEHLQNQPTSDSEDQTPLKNIYAHETSPKKKRIKFSRSKKSPKRRNKFAKEKSLEEASNRFQKSKSNLRRSISIKDCQGIVRSSSVRSKFSVEKNEIWQLEKKLFSIKRAQNEERQILLKEKKKNQELIQQVVLLNQQIKKLQMGSNQNTILEQDYQRLLDNFEKSEYIRQQQKNLIRSLKLEVESLKQIVSEMKENQAPLKKREGKL